MSTKRYRSTKRYKLSNLTVEQLNTLYEKHGQRTALVAAELGVTVHALNRWLRLNNCRWQIVVCDEGSNCKEGSHGDEDSGSNLAQSAAK